MRRRKKDGSRRAKIWMSIFLTAIMVFSGIGFYVGSNTPSAFQYNGRNFEPTSMNTYQTEIQGAKFDFYFLPQEVESLEFPPQAELILDSQQLILVHDSAMSIGGLQLADSLRFDLIRLGVPVRSGVLAPSPEYLFEVLGCPNATPQSPAILLSEANTSSVHMEGSCLFIDGDPATFGLYRYRDLLFYKYFKVIT